MNGVPETAGAATKALEVLKNLPLWLFTGLAVSAGVLLSIRSIASSLPVGIRPWIVVVGVTSGVLAIARGVSLLAEKMPMWAASRDARKRFHLTAKAQQSHWSSAKQSDDSVVTQISVDLIVKNRTQTPLALVHTRLIRPKIRGEIVHDSVIVRAVRANIYGSSVHSGHMVPPNTALPAGVHIMIRGVPRRKLVKQVRVVIGVTDDEGHEQRVKVDMNVLAPPARTAALSSFEIVSAISNPVEREVATVLQAEAARYEKCGRRIGGLGSVHLVVNGHEMKGVGGDSWTESPKNQSIIENPDLAQLHSDNLEALLAFYNRLTTEAERALFVAALIDRLDGKAYLAVSYFIVCVLWKVGKLREALRKAKSDLPQGEAKVFGLSNALMLLNGLLRYRYPDFTNAMLDDIEGFLHGMEEHPFQIPEKIAAIRTMRLLNGEPSQAN